MSHPYEVEARYGYATIYRCSRCNASRHYSWDPGWPGSYSYFTPAGDEIDSEPECTDGPLFNRSVQGHT